MIRKITMLCFIFVVSIGFATNLNPILEQGKKLKEQSKYSEAIELYTSFLKNTNDKDLKNIYLDLANCYYKKGDLKAVEKIIRKAMKKYGFKEDDFIYNDVIDLDVSNYSLEVFYKKLDRLIKDKK